MFPKWLHIVFILATASLFSLSGHTQSAATAQQKLTALQGQLQQKQADLTNYQQELAAAKAAREPMQSSSGPEKDKLDKAASALAEAQATYEADPSDTNQARVKNAEFKHALAERKYKKANEEVFELDEKITSLSKQVTATSAEVTALNQKVAQQKMAVEKARTAEVAAKQAREAEELRMKAAAAEAETARLKQEMERREREEAARKAAELAAAQKAAAAKKAAVAKPAAPAIPAPAAPAVAAAAPKSTAAAPAAPAKDDPVVLLTTKEAVVAEQQRLETILASEDKSRKGFNKILNVKPVAADGSAGPSEANSLQALGHNQYRGIARLKGGKSMFVIGFNKWVETVPGSGSQDYIVVLDLSDEAKPHLVYYPESLAK